MIEEIDKLVDQLLSFKQALLKEKAYVNSPNRIKQQACSMFKVDEHDVFVVKLRTPDCVAARHWAVVELRNRGYTYGEIRSFCNVHYDTIRDIMRRHNESEVHGSSD